MKQRYIVSQLNIINSPGDIIVSELTLVGRNHAVNGTVTALEDLTDDLMLGIRIYTDPYSIGKFKKMPWDMPSTGICTGIRKFYDPYIESSFQTNVNMDLDLLNGTLCPVPKGKHWFKNILLDPQDWVNTLPVGMLKVELDVIKNGAFAGGVGLILNIENKILY